MTPSRGLWALIALSVGLALLYAWVVPPLEGFDARAHFRYAAYLHQERQLPWPTADLVPYSYELIVQPPLYFAAIALLTAPLPMGEALAYSRAAENPYHDKGLSLRQTVDLPGVSPGVLVTLWTARLVSLLGGLAAVIGAYRLAGVLWPGEPWLGVAVAALVGLNPQFLFTAVTITNDAWVPALSVWTLYLVARATDAAHSTGRAWFLAGCCAGLAAITKYSALLIAIPGLLLVWRYWRRSGWVETVRAVVWLALGALLVAGFWYGRMLWRYGTPVPLEQMAVALPTMRRAQPYALVETLELIPWLWNAYWGVFVSILAPPLYLTTTTWLTLLAAAGWLVRLMRRLLIHNSPFTTHHSLFVFSFLFTWFIAIFAGVLHWTRTIEFGEQGRLIHAAAPAVAILLSGGWGGWLPSSGRRWLYWFIPVACVGMALWPLPTLRAHYAVPPALPATTPVDRPVMATFAGGMRLVGVDWPAEAALGPGERLPLTLYFTTAQVIPEHYTLFLHLADESDRLLAQVDGVPVQGRHPTRQWRPGERFADRHTLSAQPVLTDTLATLSIGFYDYRDPTARQSVTNEQGVLIGDRLILGQVRVLAQPFTPLTVPSDPLAVWQEGIHLVEATVDTDGRGTPHTIHLRWQATQVIGRDYTVFVQLLDANNRVVAQADQPPGQGRVPTATWRAGEQVLDRVTLPTVEAPWTQLIIGLYDASGQRLRLAAPTAGQDFLILAQSASNR